MDCAHREAESPPLSFHHLRRVPCDLSPDLLALVARRFGSDGGLRLWRSSTPVLVPKLYSLGHSSWSQSILHHIHGLPKRSKPCVEHFDALAGCRGLSHHGVAGCDVNIQHTDVAGVSIVVRKRFLRRATMDEFESWILLRRVIVRIFALHVASRIRTPELDLRPLATLDLLFRLQGFGDSRREASPGRFDVRSLDSSPVLHFDGGRRDDSYHRHSPINYLVTTQFEVIHSRQILVCIEGATFRCRYQWNPDCISGAL